MTEALDKHYDAVAASYQQAWFYEDGTEYQRWLARQAAERLKPEATSRVVDLGGGTGNFSAALFRLCGLQHKVLCVDPSEPLLVQAKAHPEVETLLADGLSFVERPNETYHRLLLKEVVHHFTQPELPTLFAGAFRQLQPGGRLVIMTRPHDSSHYPFFAAAHGAWAAAQLPETAYEAALVQSGFHVSVDHADFPVAMPGSRWLAMVRSRFWSNFNGCTEAEMAAGVADIRGRLGLGEEGGEEEEKEITFPDRIVFITGVKPSG